MPMSQNEFKVLYSDIGGVLGTNGWDTAARTRICQQLGLDVNEITPRHALMFDSYERGFMAFDEYLTHVFFNVARPFTLGTVRELAYEQSVAWPQNIAFIESVKKANRLKLGLISNEGGGITEHRVGKFRLREVADFMVISHCVHLRKPDRAIWQLALDLAQVEASEAIYIDDRAMFAERAQELGFTSIHYTSLQDTATALEELGLEINSKAEPK